MANNSHNKSEMKTPVKILNTKFRRIPFDPMLRFHFPVYDYSVRSPSVIVRMVTALAFSLDYNSFDVVRFNRMEVSIPKCFPTGTFQDLSGHLKSSGVFIISLHLIKVHVLVHYRQKPTTIIRRLFILKTP